MPLVYIAHGAKLCFITLSQLFLCKVLWVGGGRLFGGGDDHTIEGRKFLKAMTPKNSCWLHTESHTSLPLTNVMPQGSFNTDQSLDNNILLDIKKEGSGHEGRVQEHEKGNGMREKNPVWNKFTARLCHILRNRESLIYNKFLEQTRVPSIQFLSTSAFCILPQTICMLFSPHPVLSPGLHY